MIEEKEKGWFIYNLRPSTGIIFFLQLRPISYNMLPEFTQNSQVKICSYFIN